MANTACRSSRCLATTPIRSLVFCSTAASRLAGSCNRSDDGLVERGGLAGEILILAHELGEPVVAGGKPHGQRVEGFASGGLGVALHDIQSVVDGLIRRNQLGGLRAGQDRQHRPGLGELLGDDPAGQRQRIGVAALLGIECSQIVQRRRDIGVIGPQRLFPDRQRPLIERFGLG